jgi:hypothetical protein
MSAYGIILIAVGVVALTWLFASTYTGTAKSIWSPIAKVGLTGRLLVAVLTVYVLLTAGGIGTVAGVALIAVLTLHFYFDRPDDEIGVGLPGPLRRVTKAANRLSKSLFGT